MSHIVVVGASKGIGRDIQPEMEALGHYCQSFPRQGDGSLAHEVLAWGDALLLCQRYRGDREWQGEIDVSLTRTKQLCEWVRDYGHGYTSIVVMSSVAACSVEEEQPVSYHMAKAGLESMVRYYAATLAPRIRVNAILPGLTIKPEARGFYDAHPELERTYADITPMGRTCTVQDLAQAVDFLMRATYITGHTLPVDGGISLRSHWALARRVTPGLRDLNVTQRKEAVTK